jgi:hypothetical protein
MEFYPTLIYSIVPVRPYPEGRLAAVSSVRIFVNGQLLKKDGTAGTYARSEKVNLNAVQPDWMTELIADARRRLA